MMLKQQYLLNEVLLENASAIALANMLANVSQVFDDIIDNDQPVTRQDVYDVLRTLLIDIHYNEFWLKASSELLPLLSDNLLAWVAANDAEENGDVDIMHVTMITKSALTPIIRHMALLLGGPEHARRVAPSIYRFVFTETFDEYLNEHGVAVNELPGQTEKTGSDAEREFVGEDGA